MIASRISWIVWTAAIVAAPSAIADDFSEHVQPYLAQNCLACHNNQVKTVGLTFSDYADASAALAHPYIWEDVRDRLVRGTMPPEGLPRPDAAATEAVVNWIDATLEQALADARPDPGRITARRLNRAEYNNTVRDLLGVDLQPADDFPVDDSGYGFDNIGDVLTVSPVLIEKYLSAAGRVARRAIVTDRRVEPTAMRFSAPRAEGETKQIGSAGEVPYSPEGRLKVVYDFPATGDYELKLSFVDRRNPPPRRPAWMGRVPELIELVSGLDSDVFDFGMAHEFLGGERDDTSRMMRSLDAKRRDGSYVVAKDHALEKLEETRQYVEENPEKPEPPPAPALPVVFTLDGRELARYWADRDDETPGPKTFRRRIKAGEHTLFAEILDVDEQRWDPNAHDWAEYRNANTATADRMVFVDSVRLAGPFNAEPAPLPASHLALVECRPSKRQAQESCAKRILSKLARRAYRRPVTPNEVDRLARFVLLAVDEGASFEEGLQTAVQALLVSPSFLFRIEAGREPGPTGSVGAVGDYELATRLSYFLWSSTPDEALLTAAGRGELRDNEGLLRQVRRMLADRRSSALVENFAGQWLQLRNLATVEPDPDLFPEFDDELRLLMRRETELFFDAMLREDRNVLEFLDADFTFVNERLAKHYGIENVSGRKLRKVTVDGNRRGGLLSQASVLTVSSYPTRTSPVLRGLWVLENILDAPPPPPPPNVPLFDEAEAGKSASLRDQLEQHRSNPSCAVCHTRMDNLGFGLENYNPVGRWRTTAGDFPVDSSGELPGGLVFKEPGELKAILRNTEGDRFTKALIKKMLTYALGRGLERFDAPAINGIEERMASDGYRFSALINGIVTSTPFRMRRAEGVESDD